MIVMETARVQLREITEADFVHLMDLDSDPEVMTHLTDGKPSTPEEVMSGLQRCLALKERYHGRFGVWIATEKISGEFIGWFLFRPCKKDPDNLNSIELGYRLKKKFWGQGFAPEVSQALIVKGFAEGVEEIFATTMEKNSKSRKVMEKVGLKFDRNYIEDQFPGEDKRAVRYSIRK